MTLVKVELLCYAGVCQSNRWALKHGHLLGRGTKYVSYFPVCLFLSLVLCLIRTCAHMSTSALLYLLSSHQPLQPFSSTHFMPNLNVLYLMSPHPLTPSLRVSETFILLSFCAQEVSHKHLHFLFMSNIYNFQHMFSSSSDLYYLLQVVSFSKIIN